MENSSYVVSGRYSYSYPYYLFQAIRGDWGFSFQNGQPVFPTLVPSLVNSSLLYLISIILLISVGYAISNGLENTPKQNYLRFFRTNLFLYIISIPLFLTFIYISRLGFGLIYDPFRHQSIWDSEAPFAIILVLVVLGTMKLLHELTKIPRYEIKESDIDLFPENTIIEEDEVSIENQISSDITTKQQFLLALKPTLIMMLELQLIIELLFNFPGLWKSLIVSLLFSDLFVVNAILFYTFSFAILLYFILDIVLYQTDFTDKYYLSNKLLKTKDGNGRRNILIIASFTTIIVLIVVTSIIWLFTGFRISNIPFIYDPNYVNIDERNLPLLTGGHLFGTDYLGRDVFSYLLFSLSTLFIPILIAILIRPLLIIGISKIPSIDQSDTSYHIFDAVSNYPKLLIMSLTILVFALLGEGIRLVSFSFILSLIFWAEIGKITHLSNKNRSMKSQYFTMMVLSTYAAIVEIFLLGIADFGFVIPGDIWSSLIFALISNRSVLFIAMVFPLVILLPVQAYAMRRIRQ